MILKRLRQLQPIRRNSIWLKSPISLSEKIIYYPNIIVAFIRPLAGKDRKIRYLGSDFRYDNIYSPLSLQAYPFEIGNILKNTDTDINYVLDIGGNIGQFSKTFSYINKDAHIDVFEPNQVIFKQLEDNLGNNPNIKLWNFGVGEAKKKMKLKFEKGKSAIGSFLEANASNSDNPNLEKISVKITNDIPKITKRTNYDLIKIDVEGYEYEALKYLGKNIKTKYLFVEVSGIGRYKTFKHSSLFNLIKKQFGDFDIVYQSETSSRDATIEFLFKFV